MSQAELRARRRELKAVRKRLRWVAKNVPDSAPWVSLRPAKTIQDLRSPHGSLREALEADVEALLAEIRRLKREAYRDALAGVRAADAKTRGHVQDAVGKLQEGDEEGADEAMKKARAQAGGVLRRILEIVSKHPSLGTMENALDKWGKWLEAGGGSEADPDLAARSHDALLRAALILLRRALRAFRRRQTEARALEAIKRATTAIALGDTSGEAQAAVQEVERFLRRPQRRRARGAR